jgi:hypothetical protein
MKQIVAIIEICLLIYFKILVMTTCTNLFIYLINLFIYFGTTHTLNQCYSLELTESDGDGVCTIKSRSVEEDALVCRCE